MFLDHTQRRSTVGRTPLDEWSARRKDLYLTTHDTHNRQIYIYIYIYDISHLRVKAGKYDNRRDTGKRKTWKIKIFFFPHRLVSNCAGAENGGRIIRSSKTLKNQVAGDSHYYTGNYRLPFVEPFGVSASGQFHPFIPLNTLRTGSFKLFKRPFPGFLTISTL